MILRFRGTFYWSEARLLSRPSISSEAIILWSDYVTRLLTFVKHLSPEYGVVMID